MWVPPSHISMSYEEGRLAQFRATASLCTSQLPYGDVGKGSTSPSNGMRYTYEKNY